MKPKTDLTLMNMYSPGKRGRHDKYTIGWGHRFNHDTNEYLK